MTSRTSSRISCATSLAASPARSRSSLRAVRVLVLLLGALLAVPAVARGQATDTRNRALIVLDASKSMNEDAGNGGSRLDAAKAAFDQLVRRLPEGAPIGLRGYRSEGGGGSEGAAREG